MAEFMLFYVYLYDCIRLFTDSTFVAKEIHKHYDLWRKLNAQNQSDCLSYNFNIYRR